MASFYEGDGGAIGGDFGLVAFADELGSDVAVVEGDGPDLDFGGRGGEGGVDGEAGVPVGSVVAAADEDDLLAVAGEGDGGEFLAVVVGKVGEAAGSEGGAFGRIEVALAAFVGGPGEAGSGWRGGQFIGVGVAGGLVQGEVLGGGQGGQGED